MSARLALALALAAAACGGPSLPVATEADAARLQLAKADLDRGRALLIAKCSGCHITPAPRDHRAASWPGHVADMEARAKLVDGEAALITQYLTAFAE